MISNVLQATDSSSKLSAVGCEVSLLRLDTLCRDIQATVWRMLVYTGMQMRVEWCLVFYRLRFPQNGLKAVKCCGKTFKNRPGRMQNRLCSRWREEKSRSFPQDHFLFSHVGFPPFQAFNQTAAMLHVNVQWSPSAPIRLKQESNPAHVTLCKWSVFYFGKTPFIIRSSLRKKGETASAFVAMLSELQVSFKVHIQHDLERTQ